MKAEVGPSDPGGRGSGCWGPGVLSQGPGGEPTPAWKSGSWPGTERPRGGGGHAALARLKAILGNGIGPSLPKKVGTPPLFRGLKSEERIKINLKLPRKPA